jgi:hypothetical protein
MIDIYNDQFGPNENHVVKLKDEIKKLNSQIIDRMVKDYELRILRATID